MLRSPTNCTISPAANSTASSATKSIGTQIDAFYSGRNYAPIWITDGKANARADAAIAYLAHVDADGLDPADYPVPNFAALSTPADLADAEIKLTMSVITYAHHASIGRVHWSRVTRRHRIQPRPRRSRPTFWPPSSAQATSLPRSTPTSRIRPATSRSRPSLPTSAPARSKRRKRRSAAARCSKSACRTTACRHCASGLALLGDGGTTYDKALADAVKKFQQQHEIAATGTLTAATVEALNGKTPDHAADIILANMERWRWMPHQFPDTYVIVNLPDFTLHVMHDGKQVWTTRIVDRQAGHADADHDGGHEIHHRSIRPGTCRRRSSIANTCRPCSRTRRCSTAWGSRSATIRTARSTSRSRRATRTRSAASASISRTSSWSISTTRRTNTCSPMTSGHSVTAACGCRTRSITPKCCCRWSGPNDGYTEDRIKKMIARRQRDRHPVPDLRSGQPDLSDRVRRRRRQAAIPRRRLWPRQGAARHPQGRRSQGRGYPGRAQSGHFAPRGSGHARPAVAVRRQRSLFGGGYYPNGGSGGGRQFLLAAVRRLCSPPRRPRRPQHAGRPSPRKTEPVREYRRALERRLSPEILTYFFRRSLAPANNRRQKQAFRPYFATLGR